MTTTVSGSGNGVRGAPRTSTPSADGWSRPSWGMEDFDPILAGALDAFSELGYHGATVREIARRVGVKVPQLYYHHDSKEGLLSELLNRSIEHLEELVSAASTSTEDPTVRFARMVESLVRFSGRELKILRLSTEIRSMAPDKRADYVARRDRIEHLLTDAVLRGNEQGQLHTSAPRHATRAIVGMIQAITMWYRPGGELDENALVELYVEMALRMVGAETQRNRVMS